MKRSRERDEKESKRERERDEKEATEKMSKRWREG